MNDRVSEELLAAAASKNTNELLARARGGAIIKAEYEGQGYSFRADGWFNATEAAKRYGKEPSDWISQKETQIYIQALDRTYRLGRYVETSRARADRGGGTWLHPKLAVKFARWLDVDFEIWCDMQIDKILRGEQLGDDLAGELSTVAERLPLYLAAAHALKRYKLSFPVTYRALNAAAGSTCFREMTKVQAGRVIPVAVRIADGVDTQSDWQLLHAGSKAPDSAGQLELGLTDKVT
ncbi:KilA-N domain-containing protein [Duganella sp. BJB475]|uniref:KilA-N domain-containing protein n=1 Tax=Duganella sp. BJB475 TaxID=2233914 RepID=UPI000E340889|nr:KilA-N domain-containing protein [Duganella sp. BJB475]RFP19638.1 KilA-N domain-containing protein [Duganella sp. BJB475]